MIIELFEIKRPSQSEGLAYVYEEKSLIHFIKPA